MNKCRFALLLLLGLAAGCSKGNPNAAAEINGKVTYKGAPVTGGTVTFYAADGKGVYSAPIKSDGTYSQNTLPIGEMTITVETETVNPNKPKQVYGKDKGGAGGSASPAPSGSGGGSASAGDYVKIPNKYADKTKSGLTYTMVKGKQTKDIDLTD